MSVTKKGHSGHSGITNKILGKMVRAALLEAHADMSASLRHIARNTGISYSTVGKWYKYEYTPKSNHLLIIASLYPQVLQMLLEHMGFGSLWQEAMRMGIVETMRTRLDEKCKNRNKLSMERDKFVHIYVRVDAHTAVQLNQRQLWFLGQLQQGYIMHAGNLVDTWQIHAKTARRDLKGLLKAGLIQPMKNCQPRYYELL
ncbi:MAG: hypothetical protein KGI29_02360 [Pseudomonadota bacterium]|nr:hypothetical protein [Pseudomonadota bacterium]MDE3038799.1 hypothetical protein [Pseudomonadota bacterium]